jgi:type II secretory pathway pseudopilin PulG
MREKKGSGSDMTMKDARIQPHLPATSRRGGFTLTEILIVIGLILLVITLAIPALSVISGGRSVDAAQNQVSAVLARARQDAMGLQEPRGIIFFPDANTGRTVAAEVYFKNWNNRSPLLELLPDREEMELPVGVGCQVVPNFNGSGTPPFPTMGLILFDGLGQVMIRPFYIQQNIVQDINDPNFNALRSRFGALPPEFPPLGTAATPHTSQIGLLLYHRSEYDDAPDKVAFLKDNATPVLINRYNGTLLPAR